MARLAVTVSDSEGQSLWLYNFNSNSIFERQCTSVQCTQYCWIE